MRTGAQILQRLPPEQYARMMRLLEQCIIATDLAVYFRLRGRFFALFAAGAQPDWTREEHRALLRCMMMTACDLGAITKPWDVQKRVRLLPTCCPPAVRPLCPRLTPLSSSIF